MRFCTCLAARRWRGTVDTTSAYKYEEVEGWAWIFARILVGYLEHNKDIFELFDLIVPMPTYIGSEEDARLGPHRATVPKPSCGRCRRNPSERSQRYVTTLDL